MTINYNSAAALRAFLDQEKLGMRKKFGQNFLINPETRKALVQSLGAQSGDEVWEIGPGLGAMTALLLETGLKVKAFEIDLGFIRILKNIFSENKNFTLVEGDVMKTWQSQSSAPFLFGNLPYNVASALLADLIENGCIFSRMVITVQKEVALRMTATAGKPDYSSFSVLCASAYKVKPLMTIRPSSFYPQPNVDSMAVLLEKKAAQKYPAVFYPLVRALFASRRKTIKNNLVTFLSSRFGGSLQNKSAVQELCASVLQNNSLNGTERAESLELGLFLSLALSIDNMRL
ncbi:16S rRNA (adenine(1518)-N(6)/adenine(1519)-N(6))-dimethyltransferase RsmA [Treponema sp. R80B11-R83G3]